MIPIRAAGLVPLVVFANLYAQTPADTATLAEITVTATRLPVERRGAPAAITVLTGNELRARGIVRLSDALRDVPGASVVQSGSFGSQTAVFLRGGESDYTKVLVDGVPVNDAGGAVDLAHISIADVDRIEIVRGPASVLWGSDAVTGVIQIFTHRMNETSRVAASARAGTYATRDGSAELAIVRGSTQFTATGASHDTDGILDFNNDYRSRQASASIRLEPSSRVTLRTTIRHTDATYHYPTDYLGVPVDSNQYRRERRTTGALEASAPLSARMTARVVLATNELDAVSDNQVDRPGDFAYHDESDASRRVVDGRIDVSLPLEATLTTGLEWTRQRETNTSNFDASRVNQGYYAQILAGTGAPWLVTVGARIDDNEKFGTFVTSRASGSWRFRTGTRARLTVGTAFKEPAFAEVFSTSFTRGNSSLKPEHSRSVDVSLEQELFSRRATASITWFDQRFRDRVDFIPFPSDSAVFGTFANIGRATASGLELEGRVHTPVGVNLTTSYAYLETEITADEFGREGQRLLRRPMHTASGTIAYVKPRGSVAASIHRVGSRHDVGYVRLPWYTTVDLSAAFDLLRSESLALALTARLENALDEEYEAVANYRAPGRTALLGARVVLQRR